ncbi:MAG TPA: hypothetical protein VF432_00250 [Thermoanaerobaculia bacterium]
MNEEIQSGLIQDVSDLEPSALHASPADGTDATNQKRGGDSDGTDAQDDDGTDSGDADGTDNGDGDGTDNGDADGTDGDGDRTDNA